MWRRRRFRYPGRRRLPDRQALLGILFVLHTGIAWLHLPLKLGFRSGSTCYRRRDEWQRAGVRERLHALLLASVAPPALETTTAVYFRAEETRHYCFLAYLDGAGRCTGGSFLLSEFVARCVAGNVSVGTS